MQASSGPGRATAYPYLPPVPSDWRTAPIQLSLAFAVLADLFLLRCRDESCLGVMVPLSRRVDGREVHATIPETGLTHRISALFEQALRSDHGSQCPLLWRMYLKFLVSFCLSVLLPKCDV